MVVRVGNFLERGRGRAGVGSLAAADFELDGGVGDAEAVAQRAVDDVEDAGTLGEGHLRDKDVAGEGVRGGAEGPDVEVVDVEDAGDLAECGANVRKLKGAGCAFEENVECLADDGDGTPDDHGGDADGEDGVDPDEAREEGPCAAGECGWTGAR